VCTLQYRYYGTVRTVQNTAGFICKNAQVDN
jgi:hypothetical protein